MISVGALISQKVPFRRKLIVGWKIQEIGAGGCREFAPGWETEGEGLRNFGG